MALELAKHIACLGPTGSHQCLALHPDDVDASEIIHFLELAFPDVKDTPYKETLSGWPDGPNQCFFVATETVCGMAGDAPWLWMEADCVPQPDWMNRIEREHRFCGTPILGAFEPSFGLDGKIVGRHVTGVAVYPHDWLKRCPTIRTIVDATSTYRANGYCPPAFDVYIAPYAVPLCSQGVEMRHYWKSHSYKENNGVVFCEFSIPYGASNIVDMNASLIHGAKDYSLLDIVQRRLVGV